MSPPSSNLGETSSREPSPQPRSLRRQLRAVRTRVGCRSDRGVSARYDVAAARQHRWTRGDWQLLPWILRDPTLTRSLAGKCSTTCGAPSSRQASFRLTLCWLPAPRDLDSFFIAALVVPVLLPFVIGWLPHWPNTPRRRASRRARRGVSGLVPKRAAARFPADHAWTPWTR